MFPMHYSDTNCNVISYNKEETFILNNMRIQKSTKQQPYWGVPDSITGAPRPQDLAHPVTSPFATVLHSVLFMVTTNCL